MVATTYATDFKADAGTGCENTDNVGVLVLVDRIGERLGWLGTTYFNAGTEFRKGLFRTLG